MLEQIGKKHIITAAIVIAALVLLALLVPRPGMVSVRFEAGSLSPGQATILVVDVRNVLDADVALAAVTVRALDPTSIVVAGSKIAPNLAKGDSRRFSFPVAVNQTALEGSYNVEVAVDLDGKGETVRATIEVRK